MAGQKTAASWHTRQRPVSRSSRKAAARTCTPEIMQPLSPEWLAAVHFREEGRGVASGRSNEAMRALIDPTLVSRRQLGLQ